MTHRICMQNMYVYSLCPQAQQDHARSGSCGFRLQKRTFFTKSLLRKSPRRLRLKMFLTGASHPCLPLRLEALEAAQNASEAPMLLKRAEGNVNGAVHGGVSQTLTDYR